MLQAFLARPGVSVRRRLRELAQWVDRQRLQAGGADYIINYTPNGAEVIFTAPSPEPPMPFRVSLSGQEATVARGTINGLIPQIEGVPLGGSVQPVRPAPKLKIGRSGSDSTSWVAVQTQHAQDGSLESATVISTTPEEHPGGLNADRRVRGKLSTVIPLALIRHSAQTGLPERVFQNAFHHLQLRFYPGPSGARAVYWPA